jgi:hypothetical protein
MGGNLVCCKRERCARMRQEGSSNLASRPCMRLHPRASPNFSSCLLPEQFSQPVTSPSLPPLSSPNVCRVEWIDNQGNSLGFMPKLGPSPPDQPLPPPPPPPPSTLLSLSLLHPLPFPLPTPPPPPLIYLHQLRHLLFSPATLGNKLSWTLWTSSSE